MQKHRFINNFNQLNTFRAIISSILRNTTVFTAFGIMHRRCYRLVYQPVASSVHYTTSCKHSLVLRIGEIIARNMLS